MYQNERPNLIVQNSTSQGIGISINKDTRPSALIPQFARYFVKRDQFEIRRRKLSCIEKFIRVKLCICMCVI